MPSNLGFIALNRNLITSFIIFIKLAWRLTYKHLYIYFSQTILSHQLSFKTTDTALQNIVANKTELRPDLCNLNQTLDFK